MYAGLLPITGGQTQMYLLAIFVLGAAVYLKFYAMTFSPLFEGIVRSIVKQLTGFKKQKRKVRQLLSIIRKSGIRKETKAAEQKGETSEKTERKAVEAAKEKGKHQAKQNRKHPGRVMPKEESG